LFALIGGCALFEYFLVESGEPMKERGNRMVELAKICEIDGTHFYALFSKLSNEIHGNAWSGSGVKIKMEDFMPSEQCFFRRLAQEFYLLVEE
jgi:hypothetical protein